jgi:deoxyadenosine/deoxycytidine kinase
MQFYEQLEDVQLHPEPVEKWQNLNGQNLLQKLYEDPEKWSFQVSQISKYFIGML